MASTETILSRPFSFVEHNKYKVHTPVEEQEKWAPTSFVKDRDANKMPKRVEEKWIYVFMRFGQTQGLYLECLADFDGRLSVLSGRLAKSEEAHLRRQPDPTAQDAIRLPQTINGNRAYYYFFVSRIRLPLITIAVLENERPEFLHEVDLERDDHYISASNPRLEMSDVSWFVGVTDPITIALALNNDYERACNEILIYTGKYKDQTPQQEKDVAERLRTKMIAELLQLVLKSDPSDKLHIRNDFADGTGEAVHKVIDQYEKHLKRLMARRDEVSQPLIRWIDTRLWGIVDVSYRADEPWESDFYDQWITINRQLLGRLIESAPGKTYMAQLLSKVEKKEQGRSYLLSEYILRESPAGPTPFAVGRKCSAAIFGLWESFAVILETMQHAPAPAFMNRLAAAMNLIHREDVISVLPSKTHFVKWRPPKFARLHKYVGVTYTATFLEVNTESKIFKGAGKALEFASMGVEVINLYGSAVSLKEALEAEDSDFRKNSFTVLNLIGDIADFAGAFKDLLLKTAFKMSNRGIAAIAVVGAVMDVACAANEVVTGFQTNDYDFAVGQGIIAYGETISGIGSFLFLGAATTAEVPPVAMVLIIAGAVITGAGYLIAYFTKDSDIEQLIAHSVFGDEFGNGSAAPKWANGSFEEWRTAPNGLERQLAACLNVLAGYTVTSPDGFSNIRISPGILTPESIFHVEFECVYHPHVHRPRYKVSFQDHTISDVDTGQVVNKSVPLFAFGIADGREYVDLTYEISDHGWDSGTRPPLDVLQPPNKPPFKERSCRVILHLADDESGRPVFVPHSGNKVRYVIRASDGKFDAGQKSSKNV